MNIMELRQSLDCLFFDLSNGMLYTKNDVYKG